MTTSPYPRDLIGYGRNPPDPCWPGRARVAVQFVVNYEEGGERAILHGDKDASAPLEMTGKRTAAGIKGAVLKVYPGGPHGLFVTHMREVNADLLGFIKA